MQLSRAAIVAAFALAAWATSSAASADAYEGASAYRTAVFWSPADRLWTGALAPQTCERSGRHGMLGAAPRLQSAVYEQRGELIGEIRAAPAQAPMVIAQARSCATEADSATTTRGLITEAGRNWATFSTAFHTCLARNNAAQFVGSMTLWIDDQCDW